jgi:putative sterol carrier protein
MQEEIFRKLQSRYKKGIFNQATVFYFSVGDMQKTLTLDSEGCHIQDGKPAGEPDCSCSTSSDIFDRIWNEGYRPGIMDFMTGKIKSNAPLLLQQFMLAFGK